MTDARSNLAEPAAPERNAAIVAYKTAHPMESFSEIGAAFGVSRNTVAGILDRAVRKRRRAAAKRRRAAMTARKSAAIEEALHRGAGAKAIAKGFGVDPIRAAFIVRDHRRATAGVRS